MVLSLPVETIYLLSGEKATLKTSLVCPVNYLVVFPVFKSHNLKVLSHDEEIKYELSFEIAKSETKWLCPVKLLNGTPYFPSLFSLKRFQIIKVLSLDPDTNTLGSSPSF